MIKGGLVLALAFVLLILSLDVQVGIAADLAELDLATNPQSKEAGNCDAATAIVIRQRDLQFNHPDTTMSVSVQESCPCHVTDIVVRCGPDWDQSFVDPRHVMVVGDGHHCVLLSGQVIGHVTPISFLYQHSPPLSDLVPISATFVNCKPNLSLI